jgi:6-phosphofructokinase 1
VLGFRFGFSGIPVANGHEPIDLTLDRVATVHRDAGSVLGVSRGKQDIVALVDGLVEHGIGALIAIGGDGTLRGVHAICDELDKRGLKLPVVAVPKTIDNDISWVQRSFGLDTAVAVARDALDVASNEARATWDGVGLVRLMGRESGFITAMATLASGVVDFCLIPEVPFAIEGRGGLLDAVERRLHERHACVIGVAEGAGHDVLGTASIDASGNPVPHDIGAHLRDTIVRELDARGIQVNIKYIDPGYMVRGTRATANDSVFCATLGQQAVHTVLAGYTDCVIGHWSQHFTLVPTELATATRQRVNPESSLWRSVLALTGQQLAAPAFRSDL